MAPRTVQNLFFFTLLALVTVAFLWLIQGFLLPLFWAVVLAILFYPLQRRIQEGLGERKTLAAVLTLLVIVLAVILPFSLVGLAVMRESIALYGQIASGELDLQEVIRYVEELIPVATEHLERVGINLEQIRQNLSNTAVTISQYVAAQALVLGQDALRIGILFFLMLYVLFFFLRDGGRILNAIIHALPLGDVRERRLFLKFAEVSRATIKGTLVVALVQGSLGGLFFWILGLHAPVLWGVVMTMLSLLPALGSAIVWLPAAIILIATGELVKGLVLIAAGSLVIGLVDNFLRPLLVGRDTRMPDFLVLLATLGGLTLFGLSGFVIGPIIAALFLTVWQMFEQEYSRKIEEGAALEAQEEGPETQVLPEEPAPAPSDT